MVDEEGAQIAMETDARRTIERLTVDVLPRLIERLTQSELGELEVREDGWRIRLRRAEGINGAAASAAPESRDRARASGTPTSAGHADRSAGQRAASASQRSASAQRSQSDRGLVTSPAVGYFVAREGISVGTKVREGDVIGQVDMLGVSQEVVAPVEGTIGKFEVEPGEAIEFGQPLARVQPTGKRGSAEPADADEPIMAQLVEA